MKRELNLRKGLLSGFVFLQAVPFASAADGSISYFEMSFLLILVVVLCVLASAFYFMKKMYGNLSKQSDKIFDENKELLIRFQQAEESHKQCTEELYSIKEEKNRILNEYQQLKKQQIELSDTYNSLLEDVNRKESSLTALANNKKELEQLLLNKIKENDKIQRDASDKLSIAEDQLREAENIHDSFFIETIHEMRTPLSLVLGSLSLMVQNCNDEQGVSGQLISAYRNTLAMQDLADQLIGMRRSQDASSYLRVARYDMVEIVRQMCDIFVDWVAMNNVDFRINTEFPVLWVWIDRRKMEFALRMLLTNAFKNTFAYGKVTLDLSVEKDNEKAYCILTVHDEGLDEGEATRRGLKQILDMLSDLGGKYQHYSENEGSVYRLMIPLGKQHLLDRRVEFVEPEADLVKLNESQKEDIAEFIRVVPQKKETGKTLLVIDDSDQIRWFLNHVFNKEYRVLEARNGQEGIDVAQAETPDVILCDVMMPVKDGYETCREIKTIPSLSQTAVVMLTAKVESEDVITGIEAGADDYITKPFDIEILRSKINNLMKKRDEMKRFYQESQLAGNAAPRSIIMPSNPFMDAVIANIEKHLDDSTFEAKVLADSLNMSLPTLYRKIKQYSDLSILELTRNIRLKKAAELLSTRLYSVQEVSEMVGFNDTATFRKRFTEQYHVTPSQYGVPN